MLSPKTIYATIFVLFTVFKLSAQVATPEYSDVAKQRLLIRTTAQYVHTLSQGQVDMDSAIRITCKVYNLSPLLAYNEGYSDGKPTKTSSLIDAGNIRQAKSILPALKGEEQIRALIELGTYFLFKPGEAKADLEEAEKYIKEAIRLDEHGATKWYVQSLTLKAHLLQQLGQTEESKKLFQKIIGFCEKTRDKLALARSLSAAAELLPYGDPERLAGFEKALTLFRSLNAKENEIETISQIDICYFVTKQYQVAEKYIKSIIQLGSAIKFRHLQYPYDALAWLSIRKGDLSNALSYSQKSLDCVKSKGDSVFISTFYTRRGILFAYLLNSEEALKWHNKAVAKVSNESKLFWYRSFFGKVYVLNILNRPQEAMAVFKQIGMRYPPSSVFEQMHYSYLLGWTYENLNQPKLAKSNYKRFLAMAENFPVEYIHDEHPAAFMQISGFYRQIGDLSKAKELLERARTFISPTDMDRQSVYYYNLYKIDSIEKRYPDAIKHLEMSHVFTDSANSISQRKKTAELLIKYETEKKDKNIQLLNSENQLTRERAQQSERSKNITLTGIFLLLIIIGLLFSRYQIKRKSNLQLEVSRKELDQKNIYLEKLNNEQEKLLEEKEWLIKEVHHRVKNNLQMVTSLLYSQSVYLEDDTAKLAVKDSLRRMQAMALIHQKLYEDENTTTIAMPEYINDLVSYLHESFDIDNRIIFKRDIEELQLDVAQAIPLGLIITESVVNAIKYAFLGGQKGVITISLKEGSPDDLVLKISDDGIGLPSEPEKMKRNSLGLDLMNGLARQLNGNFKIENNNGVHITIGFPIMKIRSDVADNQL